MKKNLQVYSRRYYYYKGIGINKFNLLWEKKEKNLLAAN